MTMFAVRVVRQTLPADYYAPVVSALPDTPEAVHREIAREGRYLRVRHRGVKLTRASFRALAAFLLYASNDRTASYVAVGRALGVSRERARQLVARAQSVARRRLSPRDFEALGGSKKYGTPYGTETQTNPSDRP